ncbi:hypothetical protein GCM10007972_15650 [Iodidimonas muriae]|uniref:Uncharacterized protein n=2 Tax=Iodidimonas muriae TaxID=261467 RepID=A0ABQ2LD27_9PROT|nr:hypothetical protein JCM17843_31020 [Kordiimonadales bacterium JCM 17843]GGO11664.1 hypothetical protein GCM10007972_15650 [Iodidimonas muriae]
MLKARPTQFLTHALHMTRTGTPRSGADIKLLAASLERGHLSVDDLYAPLPPALHARDLPDFLGDGPCRWESSSHALLKLYARLLAMALAPKSRICLEHRLTVSTGTAIPDLFAVNDKISIACEVGATDGRKIHALLESAVTYCIVLPYSGLSDPNIHGYIFRHANTIPLPAITSRQTTTALTDLENSYQTVLETSDAH